MSHIAQEMQQNQVGMTMIRVQRMVTCGQQKSRAMSSAAATERCRPWLQVKIRPHSPFVWFCIEIQKQKDFLRDVSHEVRSPLARLQIATETLELDASDEKSLKQIKEEVLIIDQLVQDLLYLSHFDRPSQYNNIETFPIINLVQECVNRSKIQAKLNDVLIKFKDEDLDGINIKGIRFLLVPLLFLAEELQLHSVSNTHLRAFL